MDEIIKNPPYRRALAGEIERSLRTHGKFAHVMVGARQTGKTTLARQIAQSWEGAVHFAAADESGLVPKGWMQREVERAAALARPGKPCLLVLDEVQKAEAWSESFKGAWDAEQRRPRGLRFLLLGSSALLMQKGLSEGLAGRFLLFRAPHWSASEMRAAFGFSLERWLELGGYPASAEFAGEPGRWRSYVRDSLVEVALARDVLQMQEVRKPALLRHLFGFVACSPAQIVTYEKMQQALPDAGNTTPSPITLNF